LNALTNQESKVGAYDFTTLSVIPGLMQYRGAKVQILDVPGIVSGAASGKGRGKEVLSVMRSADLGMIVIDANHPEHLKAILKEVRDTGLRLNERKPNVKITRKAKGGLSIGTTVKLTKISKQTIQEILKEFRIINADVVVRSDIDADQLIDVVEANKIYIPAVTVINKIDTLSQEKIEEIKKITKADIGISAEKKIGIEELKEKIFQRMNFIEIFCKDPSKRVDTREPLIMKKGAKIEDVCSRLHRDFVRRFKFARVWGESAKFPGQKFMLDHEVADRDIVEIHLN
jgi:small GTP-binding protein